MPIVSNPVPVEVDSDGTVLVELHEHVMLVTLNRPEARNAVNGAVAQGLEAVVERVEADPEIWAAVLTGAGPHAFCAGADLKEVSAGRGSTLATERGGFGGFVRARRGKLWIDRKSTRLNSSHSGESRMPSSA